MTEGHAGYRQPGYPASLREFGEPLALPRSGGWLLVRDIPGAPGLRDAIGCYPVMACKDWSALPADLDALAGELVSVAFVADPFAPLDKGFTAAFDVVRPFKEHLVLALPVDPERAGSKHHRYYARRAARSVEVEVVEDPRHHADAWIGLYEHLVERHQIDGIRSFSPGSFREQLTLDGLTMIVAREGNEIVAAHMWLMQDAVVHSHLAASSPRGYEVSASYALYSAAIRHFTERAAWMTFGAGAGISADGEDGLTRFKRGWASDTRTAFFCGKILQPEHYMALAAGQERKTESGFFPAYREGL